MALGKALALSTTQQPPPHRFHKPNSVSPYKSSICKPTCHLLFPNSPPVSLLPTTFKCRLVTRRERRSGREESPVSPITSRFSPPENLALKALVCYQTSSHLPPKPWQARC